MAAVEAPSNGMAGAVPQSRAISPAMYSASSLTQPRLVCVVRAVVELDEVPGRRTGSDGPDTAVQFDRQLEVPRIVRQIRHDIVSPGIGVRGPGNASPGRLS